MLALLCYLNMLDLNCVEKLARPALELGMIIGFVKVALAAGMTIGFENVAGRSGRKCGLASVPKDGACLEDLVRALLGKEK